MKKRLLLLALVLGAVLVWALRRGNEREDSGTLRASGTVEATEALLGFEVPGRLAAVEPQEGDEIAAGAVLASLDATEPRARRAQAEAALDVARAVLAEAEAGSRSEDVAQGRAAANAARMKLDNARSELARSEHLFAGGAISRETLDRARLAADVAAAEVERTGEQLRLLERGSRRERIDALRAQRAQAEAALASADAALAKLELRAPFAGRISGRHREPGEIVAAGTPVLTLLAMEDRWVRIYVPENRLAAVALGAPVSISCDTFPGKRYDGVVIHLASEAEFTPKNVQTEAERVRLVYAVKVRIANDPAGELKPGMPVDVELQLSAGI